MQNKYKLRGNLKFIIDGNLRKKKKQNRAIILLNYVAFHVTNKIKRKF
jgi:hypothetical protein